MNPVDFGHGSYIDTFRFSSEDSTFIVLMFCVHTNNMHVIGVHTNTNGSLCFYVNQLVLVYNSLYFILNELAIKCLFSLQV